MAQTPTMLTIKLTDALMAGLVPAIHVLQYDRMAGGYAYFLTIVEMAFRIRRYQRSRSSALRASIWIRRWLRQTVWIEAGHLLREDFYETIAT